MKSSMTSAPITKVWLHLPRQVTWNLYLGNRVNLVAKGKFDVSLCHVNIQGDQWGDTYIRDVGLHYDDYSNWDSKQRLHAIPKSTVYVTSPYELRKFKDAAGGVTGLIGEVLTTIFLQKVLRIPPYHIAHIKQSSTIKSPDLLVQTDIANIKNLLSSSKYLADPDLPDKLDIYSLTNPLALECKSRRNNTTRLRDALVQLIDYWKAIHHSIGYGMVSLVDLKPQTHMDFLLFLPLNGKQSDILNIINSTLFIDSNSGEVINLKERNFFDKLGGCFLV